MANYLKNHEPHFGPPLPPKKQANRKQDSIVIIIITSPAVLPNEHIFIREKAEGEGAGRGDGCMQIMVAQADHTHVY